VNSEFFHLEQRETNISPSHLGELYWNFGWPGTLIGMAVIGALLGTIATRFDLTGSPSLTRVLVTIVTIKTIIIGFDGAINVNYSMWMRTLAAVGILHWLFARQQRAPAMAQDAPTSALPLHAATGARFPNLMS
jgi:purine-cytosine permease-like protein